jgi:hypothetical protein
MRTAPITLAVVLIVSTSPDFSLPRRRGLYYCLVVACHRATHAADKIVVLPRVILQARAGNITLGTTQRCVIFVVFAGVGAGCAFMAYTPLFGGNSSFGPLRRIFTELSRREIDYLDITIRRLDATKNSIRTTLTF